MVWFLFWRRNLWTLLVFKQQTLYGCHDRPPCLPFSLQNRRAEWKQLHLGPSGIHAEMKLSNASGPRTDFLMCESCAVFTDVFCLHFWTCQYKDFFSSYWCEVIKQKGAGEGVLVILLGNQLVKITLQALGKANGEGRWWRPRLDGERWVWCEMRRAGGLPGLH